MDQKRLGPLKKIPQNDEYVFCQLKTKNLFPPTAIFQKLKYIDIINMHVCNTTNRFKYKKKEQEEIRREG
jgi:hypothetical protein